MKKGGELVFVRGPVMMKQHLFYLERALLRMPGDEMSTLSVCMEENLNFIAENAAQLKLPRGFEKRLPKGEKEARIVEIAREIADLGAVSGKTVLTFLEKAQKQQFLTWKEMQFLPTALRLALMEKVKDAAKICISEEKAYRQAKRWIKNSTQPVPGDKQVLDKILRMLTDGENAPLLQTVDHVLKSRNQSAESIQDTAAENMTAARQRLSRALSSLKQLERIDFLSVFEKSSVIYQIYSENEVFRLMDRESKSYYAFLTEKWSREWNTDEEIVARSALALTAEKKNEKGDIGYYLTEGKQLLSKAAGVSSGNMFFENHKQGLFICAMAFLPLASAAFALLWGMKTGGAVLFSLCVSECQRQIIFPFIRKIFPPRLLPRIKIRHLKEDQKILVVVPCLVRDRKKMLQMARHLSVLRHASGEENIDYMLLADLPGADVPLLPEDEEIIETGKAAFEALSQTSKASSFYLLLRGRVWQETEKCYMGYERKRGAVNTLTDLLNDGKTEDKILFCNTQEENLCHRYRYVMTLDEDTFLPPRALLKLAGAMEHPLQKGRIAVIQPRMENAGNQIFTRAQKYLGGRGGLDPYGGSSQDIYQDIFSKGSFVGKGLYDPYLWKKWLEGKLPEGRLLSHDLIEGEYAISSLCENVSLYDGHPKRLSGFLSRQNRWCRGDWQLLPFLFKRNLSLLSRYKIWDNLRRSAVPVFQVLLFILAAFLGKPFLFLFAFPWPLRGSFLRLLLLPSFAFGNLDGIFRSLYRQFFSRRHLLSWVTAEETDHDFSQPVNGVLFSILSGAVMIFASLLPGNFPCGALIGILWAASPFAGKELDANIKKKISFSEDETFLLRDLAKKTWNYFDYYVSENTHFLPPDNVQLSPDKGAALHTSPTNIGLYLLSCLAAREMNLISGEEMANRMSDTLKTLEKLPKWKGNLYNWYDVKTLCVWGEKFVSSVDMGNFAMCLLCAAQGVRNHLREVSEENQNLAARMDDVFEKISLSAFYDREEKLFFIGYDEEKDAFSQAHYDMLASESRLLSFAAVIKKEVPPEHFFRLNRTCVRAGNGALLSWGGTMFEYLLPQILLPTYPDTLLEKGCLGAVRVQMAAGDQRPWGISESGYAAFDREMNYQYRAFGMPLLALSKDTQGQVIAPYASVMALPFFPRAAVKNMAHMKELGWMSELGFYEAADYSPSRVEKSPQIVGSHMAHHQGMIFCSLCNALTDFSLVRTLSRIPKTEAFLYLLTEKPPVHLPSHRWRFREREEKNLSVSLNEEASKDFPLPVLAMGFHHTVYQVNSLGQGKLQSRDILWTRFREKTGENTGPQTYLFDDLYHALFRPSDGKCTFQNGCVSFEICENGLEIKEDRWVAPMSGAVIFRLTIKNHTDFTRDVHITSFLETALGKYQDDISHPAFRDLSLQVIKKDEKVLLCHRRPRNEEEKQYPMLAHAFVGSAFSVDAQGDRSLFLGREGNYEKPQFPCSQDILCRTGDVLYPCMSIKAGMAIPAHEEKICAFVTAACRNEEEARETLLLYSTFRSIRENFLLCRSAAQMHARLLRVDSDRQLLYTRLLGALLFKGQPHQEREKTYSLEHIWKWGVSGDDPLLTVLLFRGADQALCRQVLKFHGYMKEMGIAADVCLVCEKEVGCDRPVLNTLRRLIASGNDRNSLDQKGGIHLCPMEEGEEKGLVSLSDAVLVGGKSLREQLDSMISSRKEAKEVILQPDFPPCPPLEDMNGYGGFSPEGNGYQIVRAAPKPWHHILANENFGTMLCETGILESWCQNACLNRITDFSRDIASPRPSENIELIFQDGVYSLTAGFVSYEAGAAVYETVCQHVQCRVEVFCHPFAPMGYRRVLLKSKIPARMTLRWKVRFAVGEKPKYTVCRVNGTSASAENRENTGCAWAQMMKADSLKKEKGTEAVWEKKISFASGETVEAVCVLGFEQEQAKTLPKVQNAGEVLKSVRLLWHEKLTKLTFYTFLKDADRMMNHFLPYQIYVSRLMGRTGPYQAGGAIGFRDQLQDVSALLLTDEERAGQHILLCAAHQYEEGDVQHWWHPPFHGIRSRVSDDKLFLPLVTAEYVSVTGDEQVLEESVPYLHSEPLKENEEDRYEIPKISNCTESLYQHCIRAFDSVREGKHGLLLMGSGDWNDGMNKVGGKTGESVWLSFFFVTAVRTFLPLCDEETGKRLSLKAQEILKNTQSAWTGKWYLRAWYEDGEPLAGTDTNPPRIDLITQCFSVFAGAPVNQARKSMEYAWEKLYDGEHKIIKLLDPPFEQNEKAGYITSYVAGVRENGGQYTHAAGWLIEALCMIGETERAWEVFFAVLPSSHTKTCQDVHVYEKEPYVLAGDVYAGENTGKGGWTWYTGSAGTVYGAFVKMLLGLEKKGNLLTLHPAKGFREREMTVIYHYGKAEYHLTAAKNHFYVSLDGKKQEGKFIQLHGEKGRHEAYFPMP